MVKAIVTKQTVREMQADLDAQRSRAADINKPYAFRPHEKIRASFAAYLHNTGHDATYVLNMALGNFLSQEQMEVA